MGYQNHSSILLTPHKTCEIKREAEIKLIDASITEIATLEVKFNSQQPFDLLPILSLAQPGIKGLELRLGSRRKVRVRFRIRIMLYDCGKGLGLRIKNLGRR